MSASKAPPRHRVVVDGSNIATEGRTTPSLDQLDAAVTAYLEEFPGAEVIVVADATFEHRVAPEDRSRFKEAELAGEIVTPPAGAIGRGDAFILKIAVRIGAVVLSNDSFQEFHDEHPWLFEPDRLTGGKPVPGVGWVFTPRLPVRGAKSTRPVRKLTVALPNGEVPQIGATLTPTSKVAKVAKPAKAVPKPAKAVPKEKSPSVKKEPAAPRTAKVIKVKGGVAKKLPKPSKEDARTQVELAAPVVALRRGRQPVNPEADFERFIRAYKLRSKVTGEVRSFTSHGAVIGVNLSDGTPIECYAPTTNLGNPAPSRARDVLQRGEVHQFTLLSVDSVRRIAELALR